MDLNGKSVDGHHQEGKNIIVVLYLNIFLETKSLQIQNMISPLRVMKRKRRRNK